jgi:hypothetical protein
MTRLAMPLLIAAVTLAACTPALQDRVNEAWAHDVNNWNARDRGQDFIDFFGLSAFRKSTPSGQEQAADQRTCFHPNSQRRVMVQDGVSDRYDYRWCVLQPYEPADGNGQRLDGRPQG